MACWIKNKYSKTENRNESENESGSENENKNRDENQNENESRNGVPSAEIFALHFSYCLGAVHRVHKRNESKASRFVLVLRAYDLNHAEQCQVQKDVSAGQNR